MQWTLESRSGSSTVSSAPMKVAMIEARRSSEPASSPSIILTPTAEHHGELPAGAMLRISSAYASARARSPMSQ